MDLGAFVILASLVGMGVKVGRWGYQGHVVREVVGGGEPHEAEAALQNSVLQREKKVEAFRHCGRSENC